MPTILHAPADPKKGVYMDNLLLKVEADCGYHELGGFVSRLENSQKFLKISQLSVKRGNPGPKLKVSMVIGMYAAA